MPPRNTEEQDIDRALDFSISSSDLTKYQRTIRRAHKLRAKMQAARAKASSSSSSSSSIPSYEYVFTGDKIVKRKRHT